MDATDACHSMCSAVVTVWSIVFCEHVVCVLFTDHKMWVTMSSRDIASARYFIIKSERCLFGTEVL